MANIRQKLIGRFRGDRHVEAPSTKEVRHEVESASEKFRDELESKIDEKSWHVEVTRDDITPTVFGRPRTTEIVATKGIVSMTRQLREFTTAPGKDTVPSEGKFDQHQRKMTVSIDLPTEEGEPTRAWSMTVFETGGVLIDVLDENGQVAELEEAFKRSEYGSRPAIVFDDEWSAHDRSIKPGGMVRPNIAVGEVVETGGHTQVFFPATVLYSEAGAPLAEYIDGTISSAIEVED